MLAVCDGKDGCKQEFNIENLEVENIWNDIEKTHFVCPHCNKEYVCFYTNKHIRKKQELIRNLTSESAIKILKEEISKDMKRLRKKVETSIK